MIAPSSLSIAAARGLSTTTKTPPQPLNITPRWLLRKLAWVPVEGGVFRLNRPATSAESTGSRANADETLDKYGQSVIQIATGHQGEVALPRTFTDYDPSPREIELSVAQSILRVHTRVIDLFSEPMDQFEQQLRLLIETLRERQEHALLNDREFGLLSSAAPEQRICCPRGRPTPDALDELACRRRSPTFFLAHPRAIASFGRECNRRGLYPRIAEVDGVALMTWRDLPIYPCDKLPITREGTTSILILRVGADNQGVVGLHQTGSSDTDDSGVSVRFMGVDAKAILSYLVSIYYSAAVLGPDALGMLEHVQVGR